MAFAHREFSWMREVPIMPPLEFNRDDRKFLRSIHIATDHVVCETCQGNGCIDCGWMGLKRIAPPKPKDVGQK